MAVAYQNHTEIIDTDANNSVTVTVPTSLAQNDVWLIAATIDADAGTVTISNPSGFTWIGSQYTGGDVGWPECGLFYKIAGASESSATLSYTGTDYDVVVYSVRINGNHTSAPIDATGTPITPAGTGTTIDAPDITVAENGSLAILVAACEGGNPGTTFTQPSGTTLIDSRVGNSIFPKAAIAYEARNSGAYAPGNWTIESDVGRCAQTFSIKPAATATTKPKFLNLLSCGA